MKKKRWLSLLVCAALLLGMGLQFLPVQAKAETEIYPLICVSTTDGENYSYQNGIPIQAEDGNVVFLPEDFYKGSDRLYYAILNKDFAELTYLGAMNGYAVMTVATDQSQYFFGKTEPVEDGKTYTMRANSGDMEPISRSVVLSDISSANSNGLYPAKISGDTSDVQTLAAIVSGNALVAIGGENGIFALDYRESGAETSTEPETTQPERQTEAPTEAPTGDTADGPARSTEPDGEQKAASKPGVSKTLIIAIAAAAGLVLVGAVVLLVRGKTPPQPVPPAPPVPPVPPYVPVKPTEPVKPEPPAPPVPPEPPKAAFHLYLVAVSGPNQGKSWEIKEKGLLIGRSLDADVLYPADTKGVSRKHCQVFFAGGGLSIMDLGSTSGTYLRGKGKMMANTAVQLQAGDIIYLGSKEVALELVSRQ